MTLRRGSTSVVVRADEGGVATDLVVGGRAVLARTPWHDTVSGSADPAGDESEWVNRWRGGWQLCFPSTGTPDERAVPRQGFHGAASQAPWRIAQRSADEVTLEWEDAAGLRARRRWRALPHGLSVETTAVNTAERTRSIAVAEHLVFGGDLLAPVTRGGRLRVEAPRGARLAALDYSGAPSGRIEEWPGAESPSWGGVDASTPARVAALVDPRPQSVSIVGPELTATVRWDGLRHALLWEELGQSQEAPWDGAVMALGVEPTTTPHGGGSAIGEGFVALARDETLRWSTELTIAESTSLEGEDET